MKIKLQRVDYMPKDLLPGILYVSERYGTAAHLCACGCGSKIRTPLGPTEWELMESSKGVSLWPSVGNWQQSCKSHYAIRNGELVWHDQWTPREIELGRTAEQTRREKYYSGKRPRLLHRLWEMLR